MRRSRSTRGPAVPASAALLSRTISRWPTPGSSGSRSGASSLRCRSMVGRTRRHCSSTCWALGGCDPVHRSTPARCQHTLAALQQLAQGFHVLAHFRLFAALGDVIGEQGHSGVFSSRHRAAWVARATMPRCARSARAAPTVPVRAGAAPAPGGEGQHHRSGDQEVDHAPAVEVLRAEIAVRQRLAEDAAGGVTEQAGQGDRQCQRRAGRTPPARSGSGTAN